MFGKKGKIKWQKKANEMKTNSAKRIEYSREEQVLILEILNKFRKEL